ncbi:MAG: transporter [Bacteroidales bacterium]|jgi:Tol biopolymer transport system component|nr:transporter [Bacteroidales bacterium]
MMHLSKIPALVLCFVLHTGWSQSSGKKFCSLEIYDLQTKERKVLCTFPAKIEAPNWTPDGKYLIYNSEGKLFRINIHRPEQVEQINTGFATRCNNDHVLSASGKRVAISHGTKEDGRSRIYTLPAGGGTPQLVTPVGPSYLHGWSPDEKWLSYCAQRNDNYDIYVIPAEGGEEIRLTDAEGLDDGPEYSSDGQYIWFNSTRTGLMQVWRMKADGTEQTQMTFDEGYNSWFPHVSPDGKQVVFLSYRKDDVAPGDHPANREVVLRLMPSAGGKPVTIVELFGGQGTMNVHSWSPDSRKFAFVSYEKP